MEKKVGKYTIIDENHQSFEKMQKSRTLNSFFRFIDDKTIELINTKSPENKGKIPYNKRSQDFISIKEGGTCKENLLSENFVEFLQKKGQNTMKNFYEAKNKYESLFKKRVKDAYNHYFFSFNNISFVKESPSIYNRLIYFRTLLDGESKKNSLITFFYYKIELKTKMLTLSQLFDIYEKFVVLVDLITKKLKISGLDKKNYYFICDHQYKTQGGDLYFVECIPINPPTIDSDWFYILSFYTSVLLEYFMKYDTNKKCYIIHEKFYRDVPHIDKDMDCYDIMNLLIKENS